MLSKTLKLILFCSIVAVTLSLGSCGSSRSTTVRGSDARVRVDNKKQKDREHSRRSKKTTQHGKKATKNVASALVTEARSWLGTPYAYGGKSHDGTDCSGFVMEVYKAVTGIAIPRNSGAQSDYCEDLDRDELEIGDLVFFSSKKSGGNIAHVGMYIGDGTMIHASSSKGVIESSLNQNYYVDHYVGAGRVPAIAQAVPTRRLRKENEQPAIKPVEQDPDKDNLAMVKPVSSPKAKSADMPDRQIASVVPEPTPIFQPEKPTVAVEEPLAALDSKVGPEVVASDEPMAVTTSQPPLTVAQTQTPSPASVVKNAFSASARR